MAQSEKQIILEFDRKMRKVRGGDYPVRRDVMGYYGEVLMGDELQKRGIPYEERGGLAGYDLLVDDRIKLEVRTSELKNERCFPKNIMAWGWKLQKRNMKGEDRSPVPLKYDLVTLVRLKDGWDKYDIFMFQREQVEKMEEIHYGGYQTVAKGIYLFQNPLEEAIKSDKHHMISRQCRAFNKHPERFLIDWQKLK